MMDEQRRVVGEDDRPNTQDFGIGEVDVDSPAGQDGKYEAGEKGPTYPDDPAQPPEQLLFDE
jgi:hypothetical protein